MEIAAEQDTRSSGILSRADSVLSSGGYGEPSDGGRTVCGQSSCSGASFSALGAWMDHSGLLVQEDRGIPIGGGVPFKNGSRAGNPYIGGYCQPGRNSVDWIIDYSSFSTIKTPARPLSPRAARSLPLLLINPLISTSPAILLGYSGSAEPSAEPSLENDPLMVPEPSM